MTTYHPILDGTRSFIYLFTYLFIYLFVCLFVCLFIYLFIYCLFICLLFIYLFIINSFIIHSFFYVVYILICCGFFSFIACLLSCLLACLLTPLRAFMLACLLSIAPFSHCRSHSHSLSLALSVFLPLFLYPSQADGRYKGQETSVRSGLILGLRPASERRRYFATTSLIGWAQASNRPWAFVRWFGATGGILATIGAGGGPMRLLFVVCLFVFLINTLRIIIRDYISIVSVLGRKRTKFLQGFVWLLKPKDLLCVWYR